MVIAEHRLTQIGGTHQRAIVCGVQRVSNLRRFPLVEDTNRRLSVVAKSWVNRRRHRPSVYHDRPRHALS
jgi:hypothetical protein